MYTTHTHTHTHTHTLFCMYFHYENKGYYVLYRSTPHVYVRIHIYLYIYIYMCMYVWEFICIYIYIYSNICVYIYIYIFIHRRESLRAATWPRLRGHVENLRQPSAIYAREFWVRTTCRTDKTAAAKRYRTRGRAPRRLKSPPPKHSRGSKSHKLTLNNVCTHVIYICTPVCVYIYI